MHLGSGLPVSRAKPAGSRGHRVACKAVAGINDRRLMVKLSLAQSSGSLDLSEFELDSVPEEVCSLMQLEVSTIINPDICNMRL